MTKQSTCMICGGDNELTEEHIVPRTLWERFGIDADRADLARFRTTLCKKHNQATGALHERSEMMGLVDTGAPVTKKTLTHLADWAVWVTMLLGLARGTGVLPAERARPPG